MGIRVSPRHMQHTPCYPHVFLLATLHLAQVGLVDVRLVSELPSLRGRSKCPRDDANVVRASRTVSI